MPLGIISDTEFESELNHSINNSVNNSDVTIKQIERGRGNNVEVPDSLRKIIGENAIEEGNGATKDLTSFLGISDSSLSAYKKGAHSTASYHNPVANLKSHLDKKKESITKRATNKLLSAINSIDSEKLSETKARDLAGIAKDLSVIIKNMEPESPKIPNGLNGPTFILYAPKIVSEEKFDVINLNE
jgi:hypothetical protein